MNKIDINLKQNSYSVYFLDAIKQLSDVKFLFGNYKKAIIITDDIVEKLYLKDIEDFCSENSIKTLSFVIENGEQSKNINNVLNICRFMAQNGFHRNDLLIALGGGVVGDLSGLVASIYMRGIDFVQIPTTLLAAVDASIGGKTAIDIPEGKNLVGTFYQPKAVIEISSILRELKSDIFLEGVSEVIKYGAIQDETILTLCKKGIKDNLDEIVYRCVAVKADVVSKDEKESGLRKILNFGHTYAHAIEQNSNYQISHGIAVAYGILFASYLSYDSQFCSKEFDKLLIDLINKYFDLKPLPYSSSQLINAMKKDKKNDDELISFVIANGKTNSILKLSSSDVLTKVENFRK